jgi:hypothetical protein
MDEEALRSAAILQRKFAKLAKAPEAHDEHMKNAHWETERMINEARLATEQGTRTA